MHNLSKATKAIRVLNAVAAGTTDQTSAGVDMANFESVTFIALFGTLTATQVTKLTAQQSDDDGVGDAYSDLEGSSTGPLADGDSNKMLVLEITKPRKRWVRVTVDRGTANAVIDGVTAIQSHPRTQPSLVHSTVSARKLVVSPPEGTP